MTGKMYEKCYSCGSVKSLSTNRYCNNECKRKGHAITMENRNLVIDYFKNHGRSMLAKPVIWPVVRTLLADKTHVSIHEVGKTLSEMAQSGYFSVFPSLYGSSNIRVCYLDDRDAAEELYSKERDKLPEAAQAMMFRCRENRNRVKPDVIRLWREGVSIMDIAIKMNLSVKVVTSLIAEAGGTK